MWRVDAFETLHVEPGTVGPEGGRHPVTAVACGGIKLINAVELVDVDPAATQVHVCEECRHVHCAKGNWVAIRRLGSFVTWIPAWSEMESESLQEELAAPAYLAAKGLPLFTATAWERLCGMLAKCERQELPELDSREAARLVQWSAPGGVLGGFPEKPRVRREALAACADRSLEEAAATLDAALELFWDEPVPVDVLPHDPGLAPLLLLLDAPSKRWWYASTTVREQPCLVLDGDVVLARR